MDPVEDRPGAQRGIQQTSRLGLSSSGIGAVEKLTETGDNRRMTGQIDDDDWVVVLEEAECRDPDSTIKEWRNAFDSERLIPDSDIKIERYRVWTISGALRISVRARSLPS